jgi:hypothetical protein
MRLDIRLYCLPSLMARRLDLFTLANSLLEREANARLGR